MMAQLDSSASRGIETLWAPIVALYSLAEGSDTNCPLATISPPATEGSRPATLWPSGVAGLYLAWRDRCLLNTEMKTDPLSLNHPV